MSSDNNSSVDLDSIPSAKARSTLSRLGSEICNLSEQIAALTAMKSDLTQQAGTLAASLGHTKISGPGWLLLKPAPRRTTTINPAKLMQKGVSIDVINYATETNESESKYQVRPTRSNRDLD